MSLSKEDYCKIMDGNFSFDFDKKNDLLNKFLIDLRNNNLRKEVIVDYIREAYVSEVGNVRITFDKDLRTGITNNNIFEKNAPSIKALDDPLMILEVKFDNFLPEYIKNLLQISSSQRYAISKYVICRKYIKTNNWEDH